MSGSYHCWVVQDFNLRIARREEKLVAAVRERNLIRLHGLFVLCQYLQLPS